MAKDNEQVESLFTDGELEEINGMIDKAIERANFKREYHPQGIIYTPPTLSQSEYSRCVVNPVEPKEGEYWMTENGEMHRMSGDKDEMRGEDGWWICSRLKDLHEFDRPAYQISMIPDRKATPEEIEKELIKEARRRGHKEGIRVESLHEHGLYYKLHFGQLEYYPKDDDLCDRSGNIIYEKGQWTTIDKQSIKDRIIELIKKEL